MKKILITGGFGFLGTHLVERLLKEPDSQLHVVDNLSTSPVSLEYFLDTIGRPNRLTYDICSVAKHFASEKSPKYDEIYHLASPVGPVGVLQHAGNMVREVVADCYTIIDYCVETGAKFLDVSTSEIYGGGQEGYCPESTPKIVPPETTVRLEYAIAKLAAETAIINTCRVTDLHAVIVRPFNVAGPRQSPVGGFVLPRFIQLANAGKPLTVFGDGSAIRAFTHVKDMVEGIFLAMHNGNVAEAYNIGNPHNKISILDFAKKVLAVLESDSEIAFMDPKTLYGPLYEEANDKYPDNIKAVNELGWQPQLGIDTVIRDAHEDFLVQKQAGVLKADVGQDN